METVAAIASDCASQLSIQEHIQVYKYGAASPQSHSLQFIRKQLGYFSTSSAASSAATTTAATAGGGDGSDGGAAVEGVNGINPDEGSSFPFHESKGISCIGAVPLIINFNIRYRPMDARAKVLQVTQHIRRPDVSKPTVYIHTIYMYYMYCLDVCIIPLPSSFHPLLHHLHLPLIINSIIIFQHHLLNSPYWCSSINTSYHVESYVIIYLICYAMVCYEMICYDML